MTQKTQNKAVQNTILQTAIELVNPVGSQIGGSNKLTNQNCTHSYYTYIKSRVFTEQLGENPSMLKSLNKLI